MIFTGITAFGVMRQKLGITNVSSNTQIMQHIV